MQIQVNLYARGIKSSIYNAARKYFWAMSMHTEPSYLPDNPLDNPLDITRLFVPYACHTRDPAARINNDCGYHASLTAPGCTGCALRARNGFDDAPEPR